MTQNSTTQTGLRVRGELKRERSGLPALTISELLTLLALLPLISVKNNKMVKRTGVNNIGWAVTNGLTFFIRRQASVTELRTRSIHLHLGRSPILCWIASHYNVVHIQHSLCIYSKIPKQGDDFRKQQ